MDSSNHNNKPMKVRNLVVIVSGGILGILLIGLSRTCEFQQPEVTSPRNGMSGGKDTANDTKRPEDNSLGFASIRSDIPGILEIPNLGKIEYARKRSFQLRDLAGEFVSDGEVPPAFLEERFEYHIVAFEDVDGNLLHLEHRPGRYPTSDRGVYALAAMKEEGVELSLTPHGAAPLSDPAFAKAIVLLLADWVSDNKGEPDRETSITCVLSKANHPANSAARVEGFKPSLLVQDCIGAGPPSGEIYEPKDLPYQDAIKRMWLVRQITHGADGAVEIKGVWGRTVYERRTDGIRNDPPEDPLVLPR